MSVERLNQHSIFDVVIFYVARAEIEAWRPVWLA